MGRMRSARKWNLFPAKSECNYHLAWCGNTGKGSRSDVKNLCEASRHQGSAAVSAEARIMARLKRSRDFLRRRSMGGSKQRPTRPRKTKSTIRTELRAPMTTEVEQQLRALIRKHGAKEVHDALVPLLAKCKLNDWLCVANAVERIARKHSSASR